LNATRTTDEELMIRFQQGDALAFETLFERFRGPIHSFLFRQCGDRNTAEDLQQDVFTKVVTGAPSFQHQSKFSTWIYTIARNAAVDAARRAVHRRHRSLEEQARDSGPRLEDRLQGAGPAPDRSAIAERLREELVTAIEDLPADQREVFLLRQYSGLPFEEIARIVDAKVGTVKSRMRYALEALRRELEEYADYARTLS
jgi:RNA polymerase sigma-70 factor (ECF subfamily)